MLLLPPFSCIIVRDGSGKRALFIVRLYTPTVNLALSEYLCKKMESLSFVRKQLHAKKVTFSRNTVFSLKSAVD